MASDDADRHLDLEIWPLALEVGVRLDLDRDRQIAGGRPLGAGLSLSLEPKLGPGIDPWRNLDDEALVLAIGPLNLDRRLAPFDGGQERDAQVGFQGSAAALAARPAAAHPAHQVFKDARVARLLHRDRPPNDPSKSERSTLSNPGSPPNRDAHSVEFARGPDAAIPSNAARPWRS